tara:strand:- start:73 stop:270 length:198 start_codon:yes stop_codon:yes gene_type:complete
MAHKQLRTFHLFAGAGGGILGDLLLGHMAYANGGRSGQDSGEEGEEWVARRFRVIIICCVIIARG